MLDFTRNSQDQVKSDAPSVTSIDQTYTSLEKKVCVFFMAKAGSSFIDGISPRKKTPLHTSLVIYFNVKKCVDSTKCL